MDHRKRKEDSVKQLVTSEGNYAGEFEKSTGVLELYPSDALRLCKENIRQCREQNHE